jgi:hypothetical protein
MMETSISCIKLDPLKDGKTFRLIDPVKFQTFGFSCVIPAGFETDFASMPLKLARWGKYGWAAILHDYLYSKDCELILTRTRADGLFYIFMRHMGTNAALSSIIYFFVRLFGWAFFRKF